MSKYKKITLAILCGLLGCVCFGAGDWLMLYGDTAYSGAISWLTAGAAEIAPWRNSLAMALAFPGIVLYGIALFAIFYYFTRCPLNDYARAYGYMEILPVMCELDFQLAGLYHARLYREQMLAGGGRICDYWFVGDQEPEYSVEGEKTS